jgi:hypothetical protein
VGCRNLASRIRVDGTMVCFKGCHVYRCVMTEMSEHMIAKSTADAEEFHQVR